MNRHWVQYCQNIYIVYLEFDAKPSDRLFTFIVEYVNHCGIQVLFIYKERNEK